MKARRTTHLLTVLLGDLQAARRGRVHQRAANRAMGRALRRVMSKVWL